MLKLTLIYEPAINNELTYFVLAFKISNFEICASEAAKKNWRTTNRLIASFMYSLLTHHHLQSQLNNVVINCEAFEENECGIA